MYKKVHIKYYRQTKVDARFITLSFSNLVRRVSHLTVTGGSKMRGPGNEVGSSVSLIYLEMALVAIVAQIKLESRCINFF